MRAIIAITLCLVMWQDVHAQTASNPPPKDWTLNLKNVDIASFIEQVSRVTGENFVIDPSVKGTVSVVSTSPMDARVMNEVFQTVLRVNGLIAVKSGEVTRIVPQANVKLGATQGRTTTQQMLTRVIPLRNTNMEDAVRMLKPLVSANGYLEGSASSNALIVSDYGDNMRNIIKTLQALDSEGSGEVEIMALKQASVSDIVPLIETMSPVSFGQSGKNGASLHNRLRVVADERSNRLIVRGTAEERAQIRALVQKFDQKTPDGDDTQVIRLHFADAKNVATLLRGLVPGGSGNPAGASFPPAIPPSPAPASVTAALGETMANKGITNGEPQEVAPVQSFIQADVTLNAIIVKAPPSVMNQIRSLVKQLDVRRAQVLIEAAIVEITSDQLNQLGVQLAGGDVARSINSGTTQFSNSGLSIGSVLAQLGSTQAGATAGEGLAVALGNNERFDVLIQALANTSGANLLSTPSITTLDNEEAKIVVGQNVPFRTGSFSTLNAGVSNPFTTIERQDVGITLRVVPQIHEGNLVRLNIQQEVSSIADSSALSGAADLITNKRTLETKVLAEDGETVVLGGLMSDDVVESESKVPLLGDIPLLGTLFRNTRQTHSKRNLLVFLRPTVLGNRAAMAKATEDHYGTIYALQTQKAQDDATIFDDESTPPAAAPPASTVFNPPPKTLPWLVH